MSIPRYPWLQIAKEFIQGIKTRNTETNQIQLHFPTHRELAEKYGCHLGTLQQRSQTEKWSLQREQFRRKLQIKNTEVNPEDLLGLSAKFDSVILGNLENMTFIVQEYLRPYVEQLTQKDDGYEGEEEGIEDLRPLTPKDINDLVKSQESIFKTVRGILGEPNSENLLDDARNAMLTSRDRKGKKVNKVFLEQELKRISEIKQHETELEMRRTEILKLLKEDDGRKNNGKQ
ncbi:hypothetical protein [Scytonema sp. NUACC26]|uniref:hypothetical protein n=1 Tax=Scytonema sp. NUACC26 TaxID=3140176 RepID=UPI0034DC1A94